MTLSSYDSDNLKLLAERFKESKTQMFDNEEYAKFSSLLDILENEGYIRNMNIDGTNAYRLQCNLDDFIAKIKSDEKDERKEKRSEFLKDIILLIIGGFIALFFEHFFDIIDFVKGLF